MVAAGFKVTRLSNPRMPNDIEFSVESGNPVLIENMGDGIDAAVHPFYGDLMNALCDKGGQR